MRSPSMVTCWSLILGAPLPTLESGERFAAPAALPKVFASMELNASELTGPGNVGFAAAAGAAGVASNLADGCGLLAWDCVSVGDSVIFWSDECACSTITAGACGWATGAGLFRTRLIATRAATKVVMLMMRSSLSFIASPKWPVRRQQGPMSWYEEAAV